MIRRSLFVTLLVAVACDAGAPSADTQQANAQERTLKEATSSVGMPNITNWRERRILKDILELRDKADLSTYTYLWSEQRGCLVRLGATVGYPIPYATQYTNPERIADSYPQGGFAILPQADPNGLFSPSAAEGSWVIMQDAKSAKTAVVYAEPRLVTLPFEAPAGAVCRG